MNFLSVLFLLSLYLSNLVDSAKILSIFHTPSKSHWILGQNLLKNLANAGHEITVISPFPLKNPPKNYRDISTVEILDVYKPQMDQFMFGEMNMNLHQKMSQMLVICHNMTYSTLIHPNVVKLIESGEKFDLIFMEIFLNDVFIGFSHLFNAPVVGMSTMGATSWISELTGNPLPYSYVPHMMSGYTDKMGYIERAANALINSVEKVYHKMLFQPLQVRIVTCVPRNVILVYQNLIFFVEA